MYNCTLQITCDHFIRINEFIIGKRCLPYVTSNILQHVFIELDQESYFYLADQMRE